MSKRLRRFRRGYTEARRKQGTLYSAARYGLFLARHVGRAR